MVPITSAGSRSGVNWMRENAIRRHSATVRTASVFASPGTPSSRTCPPVSSPTSSRSTMTSWPTTRLATSRVIDWLSTASPVGVFAARVVIATPPPPPCAPPAPCLCCTVPVARALPAARCAATPRPPPPAPSRCAGGAFPPAPRTAPGPRVHRARRAGRSPAATLPVPLRPAPAPAAGSEPCSPPGRRHPHRHALVFQGRHRRTRDLAPARFREPDQGGLAHELGLMVHQRQQQRHRLRAPGEPNQFRGGGDDGSPLVREASLQRFQGPVRRLPDGRPVRGT